MDDEQLLNDFFYLQWLRPDNVPWDVAAAKLIMPAIESGARRLEIGTGNGLTSFVYLGGRFRPEFDWYVNADTTGFWANRDIYDAVKESHISHYVAERPKRPYSVVVDHKANLIQQAEQLGVAEKCLVVDGNGDLSGLGKFDLIFSNMLYWLDRPLEVIGALQKNLNPGGRLVTAFPNSNYTAYCRSYRQDTPLWRMINRGRADTMKWSMDPDRFAATIAKDTDYTVEKSATYLCRQTLQVWDIGLRPFSPYLIDMANKLDPAQRLEIKQRWCEDLKPMIRELVAHELAWGGREGGYNFFVLRR